MVLPSAQAGGAERVLLNLARSFDRGLFELHLVLIDPTGPYLDLVPYDVRLHGLGYKRVSRAVVRLVAVLRNLKADVILSSIGHLNLALLFIKPLLPKATKIFVRESNIASLAFAMGAKNAVFRLLYRILYPRADGIICPAEAIRKDLKNNFRIRDEKMLTIPNPVPVDMIRSKMRARYNPPRRSGARLVAVGYLTRQKGFDLLIKAMGQLVTRRPNIHLTILGDGPDKHELLDQIQSLNLSDSITLAGFKENPYPFLFNSDLFVLSSRWEGLPNVVLESLACGTPVVAFECPSGVREIFDESSQGSLVPARNVGALAKAIDQWLKKDKPRSKDSLLPARFELRVITGKYERILSGG
jgi:glycosyltransferase involved in cell wall biosynthesis